MARPGSDETTDYGAVMAQAMSANTGRELLRFLVESLQALLGERRARRRPA